MTLEDRRNREINEMRNLILNAAKDIISNEGIEKLSIRKIAKKLNILLQLSTTILKIKMILSPSLL